MQQLTLTLPLVDLPGSAKTPPVSAMTGDVPDGRGNASFADILEAGADVQDENPPDDPDLVEEGDPQDSRDAGDNSENPDSVDILLPGLPVSGLPDPGNVARPEGPAVPAQADLPPSSSGATQSADIRLLPPSAQPFEAPVLPSFPSEGRPHAPRTKGHPALPENASATTRPNAALPAAARPDTNPGFSIGHQLPKMNTPAPPVNPGIAPEGRTPLPVTVHTAPMVHTESQATPASIQPATPQTFSNADLAAPVAGATRAHHSDPVNVGAAKDTPEHAALELPESKKPQNIPSVAGLFPGRGETVSSNASDAKGPPSGIPVPPQATGLARKPASVPPDHPLKQAEIRSRARSKHVDAPPAPAFGTPSSPHSSVPQMMPESRPSFVALPHKAEAIADRISGESLPVSDLRFSSGTGGPRIASDTPLPRAELPRHIAMQLAEAVQRGGPGRPTDFVMNPVELGRVKINLTTTDGTVVVQVSAERPETLDLMRRHADMLAQEFLGIGYGEARFSFSHQGSGNAGPDTHANHNSHHPNSPEDVPLPNANETSNLPTTITDRVDIRV